MVLCEAFTHPRVEPCKWEILSEVLQNPHKDPRNPLLFPRVLVVLTDLWQSSPPATSSILVRRKVLGFVLAVTDDAPLAKESLVKQGLGRFSLHQIR